MKNLHGNLKQYYIILHIQGKVTVKFNSFNKWKKNT